jgi:hypothetical protein
MTEETTKTAPPIPFAKAVEAYVNTGSHADHLAIQLKRLATEHKEAVEAAKNAERDLSNPAYFEQTKEGSNRRSCILGDSILVVIERTEKGVKITRETVDRL